MTPRPQRSAAGTPPAWHDETLHATAGGPVGLRVYGAKGSALVLHFHGGSFVTGSLATGEAVAQVLADAGAAVASLDYPLAPAHPFPQAVEAGYAALLWLDRQRKRLAHADAPLFVAGEEAGGNLAAAVALMARDRGGPPLAGQILLSPMLDVCVATASQRDARDGPVGCPCADGWRAYLAQATDALHPYAAPGESMRLTGLPRTLLVTSLDDPLRDETQAYAERLRAAGIAACSHVLPITTGWPASYQWPGPAPWTRPLRELIQPLFQQPQAQPIL
ncbi:MAG: alpha/beta hydrolase [Rubrivivax sp.]|nr:alpha/beta hydrolase [Rubrivivax sp.]